MRGDRPRSRRNERSTTILISKCYRLFWSSLTTLLFLASCAAVPAAVPTPQATPSPEAAGSRRTPLALTFWHTWSGRSAQALDIVTRRYEQSHNVRISLRAQPAGSLVRDYAAAVADGSAPQLLLTHSRYLGDLAERRLVLPLQEPVVAETVKHLLPAAVAGSRVSGVMHGVPISFDSLVLFYDRRQMPAPPKTLDDLAGFVPPQATATSERMWSLGYYLTAATALPYLQAFDGGLFRGKNGGFDEGKRAASLRWLEWLQSMRADGRVMASDDFGAVDAAIQSSRVSSAVDWSFRLPNYQRLWGADAVGIAALPPIAGQAVPPTLVLSDVACINTITSAEQRSAAIDFLLYLATPPAQEVLLRGGQYPVNLQARVEEPAKSVVAATSAGVPFPNPPGSARAWPIIDEMVRSVLSGSATPNEALDKATTALRAGP